MAIWTPPSHVTSGPASSAQQNAEVVDNLQYLHDELEDAWADFTPGWIGVTLGTGGVNIGRYKLQGKSLRWQAALKLGTGGAFTTTIQMTGPATIRSLSGGLVFGQVGVGYAHDQSSGLRYAVAFTANPGTTTWVFRPATQGVAGLTSTVPFTWAVGDELHLAGEFEVA